MSKPSRYLLSIIALIASFVLPVLIVLLSISLATTVAPLAEESYESNSVLPFFIRDGQLYFGRQTQTDLANRIMQVDLKTGVEREFRKNHSPSILSAWPLGKDLIGVDGRFIYEQVDSSFEQLGPRLTSQITQVGSDLFIHQGLISSIVRMEDDEFYLVHLDQGNWYQGRRIRLPLASQVWRPDSQSGRLRPRPMTSPRLPSTAFPDESYHVHVVNHADNDFLLINCRVTRNAFSGFRNGFEFDLNDNDGESVSAEAPENFGHEISGWMALPTDSNGESLGEAQLGHDKYGPLLLYADTDGSVYRPDKLGGWERTARVQCDKWNTRLLVDPVDSTAYLVERSSDWGVFTVRRIEQNDVIPIVLRTPGTIGTFLHSRLWMWIGFLGAWFVHFLTLIGFAYWFQLGTDREPLQFGERRATIACGWKRLASILVDLLIAFSLVLIVQKILSSLYAIPWTEQDRQNLGRGLIGIEKIIHEYSNFGAANSDAIGGLRYSLSEVGVPLEANFGFYWCYFAGLILVGFVKILIEGLGGRTIGKWLFDLRTLNFKLKRPGIFRCFWRDLFSGFDFTLYLSPIPAMIRMACTEKVQRWGDDIAGTAVIVDSSLDTIAAE